jgi:MFS family permease
VLGLAATFAMNFQVLVPVLAQDVLGVGSSGFGFLMAASGVGSLAAALGVAFARRPSPRAIGWGALALGGASVVLAVSRVYPLSLGAMLVAGAGGIAMAVTANTTIQAAVPDRLRGRVVSVYVTIFSASVPAGGLLMGGVASVWGVPLALGLGGVVTIVVGAAALVALGRLPVVASAPTAGAASVGGAEPMGDRAGVRRR